MSWQIHYGQRVVTADEAVEVIRSGDRVVLGNACGKPLALFSALEARAAELENVEVFHFISFLLKRNHWG